MWRLLDWDDADFLEVVVGEHFVPLLEEARSPQEPDDSERIEYLRVYNAHEDGWLRREFESRITIPDHDTLRVSVR